MTGRVVSNDANTIKHYRSNKLRHFINCNVIFNTLTKTVIYEKILVQRTGTNRFRQNRNASSMHRFMYATLTYFHICNGFHERKRLPFWEIFHGWLTGKHAAWNLPDFQENHGNKRHPMIGQVAFPLYPDTDLSKGCVPELTVCMKD